MTKTSPFAASLNLIPKTTWCVYANIYSIVCECVCVPVHHAARFNPVNDNDLLVSMIG